MKKLEEINYNEITDFSSREFKIFLEQTYQTFQTYLDWATLTSEDYKLFNSINIWLKGNEKNINQKIKEQPNYIYVIGRLGKIEAKFRIREKAISTIQAFLDSPTTCDLERVKQLLFKDTVIPAITSREEISFTSLLDINEVIFDYSKMNMQLPNDIQSEDLTITGHIFYSPEHRQTLYSDEKKGYVSLRKKMFKDEKKELIYRPDFNVFDYTEGQIIILNSCIHPSLKDELTLMEKQTPKKREDMQQEMWNMLTSGLVGQYPQEIAQFKKFMQEGKIQKFNNEEEKELWAKKAIEQHVELGNPSTFTLTLLIIDRALKISKLNFSEQISWIKKITSFLGYNYGHEERSSMLGFITPASMYDFYMHSEGGWKLNTIRLNLKEISERVLHSHIKNERIKLQEHLIEGGQDNVRLENKTNLSKI